MTTTSQPKYSVCSMTGFGSCQQTLRLDKQTISLNIELRSVNSRFLDLYFRLPDELKSFEPSMRELLSQNFNRGKIEVKVQFKKSNDNSLVEPSAQLLQQLGQLQDYVKSWLPAATELSVRDVLTIAANNGPDITLTWPQLSPAIQAACAELSNARRREGSKLAAILLNCNQAIKQLSSKAEQLVPQLVQQQTVKFHQKLRETAALLVDRQLPEPEQLQEKILAEVTAFAMRSDIAEEIDRLKAHTEEITHLLAGAQPSGKRLDFIIQELNREANTLGSKAASLELNNIAVDLKVLIEQMREQVQNIE